MPKQKFCLRSKSHKHDILFACASTVLGLFVALALFPIAIDGTKAEGQSANGIDITTDAPVVISLAPLANDYKIAKNTVTVNTGGAGGYQLFISADSADHQTMYLDEDPTNVSNKIDSTSGTYAVPAALTTNTWGYAIAGLDNFDASYNTSSPSASSKFAAVPLDVDKQLIHDYDGSTTDFSTEVYYGVKSGNTLVAGDYVTEITYTAIPTAAPRAAKAVLDADHTMTFVYDSNSYNVGDAHTNINGDSTIAAVYDVPAGSASSHNSDSATGWMSSSDVYYVDFDSSFADFEVINTSHWFYAVGKLQRVTNITNFNTSKTVDMYRMFYKAGNSVAANSTIYLNLDDLDTNKVKDMQEMFREVGHISSSPVEVVFGDLSDWDVSEVTTMYGMFRSAADKATTFSLGDLGEWDVGQVKDMAYLFYSAGSGASTWSVGNLGKDSNDPVNHPGWNTANVTTMYYMFYSAGYNAGTWNIGDIGSWNVGEVTSMSGMFYDTGYKASVWYVGNLGEDSNDPTGHPGWKPAKVTSMSSMFYRTAYMTDDWSIGNIGSWDVSLLTSTENMFNQAGYNSDVWNVGDIGSWTVTKLKNMANMFDYAGYNSGTWIISNLGELNTSNVTDMKAMFNRAGYSATTWSVGNLGYVDAAHPGWDTSKVTDMWHMFYYAAYKADSFDLGNIGSWNISANKRVRAMFDHAGYSAKTWNIGKLSYVDANHQGWTLNASATDLGYMFSGAGRSAEHVFDIGDLGSWNVSTVTDMSYMFDEAGYAADTTWNIGDLSSWNTVKVTNMSHMFCEAGYTIDSWDIGNIDNWNVSRAKTMVNVFDHAGYNATYWNIGDISGWTTATGTSHSSFITPNVHGTNTIVEPVWN